MRAWLFCAAACPKTLYGQFSVILVQELLLRLRSSSRFVRSSSLRVRPWLRLVALPESQYKTGIVTTPTTKMTRKTISRSNVASSFRSISFSLVS
jgi:hypothetical protein